MSNSSCSPINHAAADSKQPTDFGAVAILVIGSVLFSTKAIMIKLAMQYGVEPVALLLLRMLFALPFYVVILIWARATAARSLGIRSNFVALSLLGIVGYYLASYFDFVGLSYVSAGLERVILYSFPTLVLLIGASFFKQPIRLHQVIAIVLCYGGILIAVGSEAQDHASSNQWYGAGLVFLSALSYAIYVVGSGQLIPKLGVWVFTSCAMMVSTVCIVTHHAVTQPMIELIRLPWPVYAYGAAMAFFATVVPSFMISEGIKRLGASNASIIGGIGPISTIVLAAIFLGETFTLAQGLGTALVMAGVLFISLKMRRR